MTPFYSLWIIPFCFVENDDYRVDGASGEFVVGWESRLGVRARRRAIADPSLRFG
jgi:hypothetical protein